MALPHAALDRMSFSEKLTLARWLLQEAEECFAVVADDEDLGDPSDVTVTGHVVTLESILNEIEEQGNNIRGSRSGVKSRDIELYLAWRRADLELLNEETPVSNFNVAYTALKVIEQVAESICRLFEATKRLGGFFPFEAVAAEKWPIWLAVASGTSLRHDGTLRLLNALYPDENIGDDLRIAGLVENYLTNGLPDSGFEPWSEGHSRHGQPVGGSLFKAIREAKHTIGLIEGFNN